VARGTLRYEASPRNEEALRQGLIRLVNHGYNERFNGKLRREVLNAEWFATTKQAQVVINQWLRQYNHVRPHHALGKRPSVPEVILVNPPITGTDQGG